MGLHNSGRLATVGPGSYCYAKVSLLICKHWGMYYVAMTSTCVGKHGGRGELFAHLQYPGRTSTKCFQQDEAITLNCTHSDLGEPPGTVYWIYSGSSYGNTASVLQDSEIPNAVYQKQSAIEHIIRISPIMPSLNGQTVQCQYQMFTSEGEGQPVQLRTITSNKAKILLVPGTCSNVKAVIVMTID